MLLRLLVPVVAVGLLLSGCGASPDAPAPPEPSPTCTPEFGGDEYPCSQAEFQRMEERDALYAEAEQLNDKMQQIVDRLYREGVTETLMDDLKLIAAGSAREEFEFLAKSVQERKIKMVGGETRIVSVKRNPAAKEGSEIALSTCVDASSATLFMDGEDVGPGDPAIDHFYFKRVDGVMKIWAAESEHVESCD